MDLRSSFQQAQAQRLSSSPVLGIDVYHGDGPINWKALAATGRAFAWIKASEGETVQDEMYHTNREQSRDAKVITGPYHFVRPKTAGPGQIKNFLSMVGSLNPGDLPPALDLEAPKDWKLLPAAQLAEARAQHLADWQSIALKDRVQIVLTMAEAIHQGLGMPPVIYASPSFIGDILGNDPRLGKYLLWLANYNVSTPTIPAPWSRYTWWQFSEHGSIPEATKHELDLNRFEGSIDDLKSLCFQGVRVEVEAEAEVGTKPTETDSEAALAWYDRCPFTRWLRSWW